MDTTAAAPTTRPPAYRWECPHHDRPVLLGTVDGAGRFGEAAGGRCPRIAARVRATCPRCGSDHLLDLRGTDRRAAT